MLSKEKKRQFVLKSHTLKPVVMIGNKGLTDKVLAEIEIALNHHELIKLKIAADRDERKVITQQIIEKTGAELIQSIGQVVSLYRSRELNEEQ